MNWNFSSKQKIYLILYKIIHFIQKKELSNQTKLFFLKYRIGNDLRPNSVVEFTRLTEWKHPWGVFPREDGSCCKDNRYKNITSYKKRALISQNSFS